MATINPTGSNINTASNPDRLNPTIQTTLSRLGRALTIRGSSGQQATPARDSVQISPAAASASRGGAAQGIADIGVLLSDLETLVAEAAQTDAGADVRAEAQRRIDEAVVMISRIAGADSVGEVGSRLNGAPGFSVVNRNDGISNVVVSSELKQDERVDVDVTVLQSAQVGGFFLSFGGVSIDLGVDANEGSSFVLQVAGSLGSRELSFASGTTLDSIAAAMNTFSDVTGVEAVVDGTGIRLESSEIGADEFVGITIIDDGSINSGDGIHRLKPRDANAAQSAVASSYADASSGLTDFGQDIEGTINGVQAQVNGNTFSASLLGGRLDVSMEIDIRRGVYPGEPTFFGKFPVGVERRAFTVIGGRFEPSAISGQNERIENIAVENRALGAQDKFDVEFSAGSSAQAQRAGVFLKLGSYSQSTTVGGDLSFTLDGPDGSAAFSLLSGQSIGLFAQEVNQQSDQLGAQAVVSGGFLLLVSNEFGDDEHISLQIDSSDFYKGTAGRLDVTASGGAKGSTRGPTLDELAQSQTLIEDRGRDIRAWANGIQFTSVGKRVVGDALGGDLHFEFDVAVGGPGPQWQGFGTPRLEDLQAFTINGADFASSDVNGPPVGDVPLPGSSPISQALAPFTTAGANAGDFVAALDAIHGLRERLGGAVTDDSLTGLRRDLIARAGAALDITSTSDAQRALDLLGGATTND